MNPTEYRHIDLVTDAAPIAIVVADAAGLLRSANERASRLFGYEPGEIVGHPLEMLMPQRFRRRHPALRLAYIDAPATRPMGAGLDLFGLRKDGREIPIEIGLAPFMTESGLAVLATVIDNSERQVAQEHLRLIIDAAPNAKILADAEGRIALVNAEAERLFGFTRHELLGTPVDKLLPLRFRGGHASLRNQYLSEPTTRAMGAGRDLYALRKDGSEVPVEIGLGPIFTPKGRFVLASIIDITERKHLEALRIASAGVLQHNAELEALNDELESFSYSVSHDLRAPLRAIAGYARMLEEASGAQLDIESRRLLGVVQSEAGRMGVLVDDILELSRLGREVLRVTLLDMNALVGDIVRDVRSRRETGAVVIDVGSLPPAYGDRAALGRVWENLLSNAVKYSRGSPQPLVRISGGYGTECTEYHVADNGVGFDMKYAGKLFGVFQRLHGPSEFEGTGVGLAIAYRIVAKHRGRIWAQAEPGRGATFSFALPLHQSR